MRDERSMPPSSPDIIPESQAQRNEVGLATITLRQIRVSRTEVSEKSNSTDANPMNRLVPYLDLYGRLSDDELSRITGVDAQVVGNLRRQVVQVDRALARFVDLLPRLTDPELVRLTGATPKTIRFWRLCQPRFPMAGADAQGWSVAGAADQLGRVSSSGQQYLTMSDEGSFEGGTPSEPRHAQGETLRAGETLRIGSAPYRMPTAEREMGSSPYRMPTERETGSAPYRMPAAERDAGRRGVDPPTSSGSASSRMPEAPSPTPVDLSRPRTGRTREVATVPSTSSPAVRTGPPPEMVEKQQAVAQQMKFSGAPFPGHDSEASGRMGEDDGIFIGLELPDPRPLPQDGRR